MDCVPQSRSGSRGLAARFAVLVACVLIVWSILAARLVHLQLIRAPELAETAIRQRTYIETIPARPGEIVDRHGRLLATTVDAPSLFVVPACIASPRQTAAALAGALSLNADQLKRRIERHRDAHFLWIKRRLSGQEADAVRSLGLRRNTWGFRDEFLRKYPQGALAAHVLGLRDIDGNGRGGVEQLCDSLLRGRDGRRMLVRDAMGRVIEVRRRQDQAPKHGRTVVLTLDCVIQLYAERTLERVMEQSQPKSACAVVLDVPTCEVLALASRPAFNPNNPADVADVAWKNTAVAAVYEPGSTVKPLFVAWALDWELIEPDEEFDCEQGSYRMGRRVLHDHHAYGRLSVTDVLVKSSNIGMAKIGRRLTNAELYKAAVGFGFGRKTGCGLPGELSGMVRPLDEWTVYSTASVPMGQEFAVTPLQLIVAHAALANRGELISPRLVLTHLDRIAALRQNDFSSQNGVVVSSKVLLPETARWIVEQPMTQVVERGTGTRARLEGFRVFGKSGTAQKLDPATGTYSKTSYVSSFVCGGPSEDPRVLVLVVVDEPAGGPGPMGGVVAAPAAADILKKSLLRLGVRGNAARVASGPQ